MSKNAQITRRSLIAGAGAAVPASMLGLALAPAAHAADFCTLDGLIDAHHRAYVEYDKTCCLFGAVQDRVRHQKTISVALTVYPDGATGELRDVGPYSLEDIRAAIETRHAELRRVHCGSWSKRMAPDHVAQLERQIDASLASALARLEGVIAEQAQRELDAGLPAAERAVAEASALEQQTRINLLLYRPKDMAEAAAKEEYISASEPFIENWYGEETFVIALINRLGEVA
jgi:hypothetical protein